jgi:histidinol-phosphate/aromatic aminotransferase/cobyric acid decarboxylase-like protein
MNSIEWLRNELVNNENIRWRGTNINVLIEQAKEMHKQEMSDSYKDGWMSCEKWFEDKELDNHIVDANEMVELPQQETFVSKGSDDHISDISKMVVYTHDDVIKMMDTFHTSILNRDLCMAKLTPIELPKQEISDEEIEKLANEHILYNDSKRQWVIEGMKLYREHLKKY